MIDLHITKITQIVEGRLFAPDGFTDPKIEQVITDSRTFVRGEDALFFALKGQRTDGHLYVAESIRKGVNFFVISDPTVIDTNGVFILVKNTVIALQQLAAWHRARFRFPVAGITGSNGKTIVKEWLNDILSESFRIVRSPKSYNSQIGVPLSLLQMEEHFNLGIFEAGISLPGEMKHLAAMIQPDLGILTHMGDAHQENFTSMQAKTEEKLKLFFHSKKLVFSADQPETAAIVRQFCDKHRIKQISWSLQNRDACIHFSKQEENEKTTMKAILKNTSYRFTIPFTDASSIENACHCFAALSVLTDDPGTLSVRFERLSPVTMRLEIKQGINNCLLIDDYYNSDLASLSIALPVLGQQAKKGHLKKQVILSDIQQTGIARNELYRQVNQLLEQWQIDELTGIGPEISMHSRAFSMKKSFYPSTDSFKNSFRPNHYRDCILLIKGARTFAFEKISALLQQKAHQTVLEIEMNALVHNLHIFKSLLRPATKIMVMVKAFSYGSGDVEIAKLLQYQDADYLAVAVADEGVELRRAGIRTPIIVMNPEEQSFRHIIDHQLEPNIYSEELLKTFDRAVSHHARQQYPIHLKLDTGMNRLGFKTEEEINRLLDFLRTNDRLKVLSVFSHLAASDEPALDEFTRQQFSRFEKLSEQIISAFNHPIDRHILNSAGIERFPEQQMEMVRLGIGLYGISTTGLHLQPISTFRSTVSQVKIAEAGETAGYGRKGKISKKTQIAIVPAGYADGLDRKLGNGAGQAFIKGKRAAILGNICMDMLMLDVTGLDVHTGDVVEFFGPHIPLNEVAEKAGTIPYEILTGISQRVKRVYLHE